MTGGGQATITIYTDGGCRPNPGPGGWGAVILYPGKKPVELQGGEPATTNNRMELRAAIEALASLEEPHEVELITDSEYLRQGITKWMPGWRKKGWTTSNKSEVKNQDLWQELLGELGRHRVSWQWVKGHAGDRWNERADRLAAAAIPSPELPLGDTTAVHLFTAAAYSGKLRTGGWAAVLCFRDSDKLLEGQEPGTTANRMHLQAAVAGLEALKRRVRVHIYTVSGYLKDGASSWLRAWKARGWRTKEGDPVKNRDLWMSLDRLCAQHEVHWHVVSGDDAPATLERAKEAATQAVWQGHEEEEQS